jgi:hypothetical protein
MQRFEANQPLDALMQELGYRLEGTFWIYEGPRGESRLAQGPLMGLLAQSGSQRLRTYVLQERNRCLE